MEIKIGRIGVLMGGPSSEREISLKSGKAIYQSLIKAGVDAVIIDITTSDIEDNICLIKSHAIDCAFIALHGFFGEDGQIQSILDRLLIPYTGSGKSASRLAMDKVASRKIIAARGLHVPEYKVVKKYAKSEDLLREIDFNLPWVIKPIGHGSSVGLSIIDKKEDLARALKTAFEYDDALIEEYIKGRELTVGIIEDTALAVIEVVPRNRLFDYQAKYTPGMTDYIVPAKLPDNITKMTQDAALLVHKLLGCSGCSRVDMILDSKGMLFILELNSIPGFTETSLLPKAAVIAGIEFSELCFRLIRLAYEKAEVSLSS
jgi:D-alanine-D-alanine ligase